MDVHAVEITTLLNDADKSALWGWGDDIFRTRALALEWRPKEWHLIAREEGRALSKVSVLRHTVAVAAERIEVGGIGGVVTVPQAQHRGLARALMLQAQSFMRENLGVDFGFLFCLQFMLGFYAELGWIRIEEQTVINQSDGRHLLPPELNAMILPLASRSWPAGNIELESLPW
jgi:GNAT superfamily N-acetyltransferase